MATTLWLVRHGETQANADRIFQGQLDTTLNARGLRQASEVGLALRGQRFDAVYTSDLTRCVQTTKAIVSHSGSEIQFEPDIRELHYGVLQGVGFDRFRDVLAIHGMADEWGPGIFSEHGIAPPGGESILDLRDRVARFAQMLDERHSSNLNHQVLVVSHGGTLRVLMTVLLGLPVEGRNAYAFANCSVTRLIRDENGFTSVDCFNEIHWDESDFPESSAEGDRAYGVDQASDVIIRREVGGGDPHR